MKPASSPYYVDWAITHRCNLSCAHCRGMSGTEISSERALALMGEIAELKPRWVLIEGGEPLMRPDLFSILRSGHDNGLAIFLISNGMLLTEEIVGRLASHGIRIMLSIDSPDRATFEALRKGALFSKVTRAAEICARSGILDAINITISRYNASQIGELFTFARTIGAKRINILGLKPCERYTELILTPSGYREAIELCCQASRETGIGFFFDEPFFKAAVKKWRLEYGNPDINSAITINDEPGCILGKYIFITPGGDVWPCSFAPRVMGNVHRDSLPSIWAKMGKSRPLRKLMDPGTRKGACASCEFLEECKGCRARTRAITGDWFAEDPACPIKQ